MEKIEYQSISTQSMPVKSRIPKDEMNIQNLLGKEMLEEIQNQIARATGLAFVTVDYRGEPITQMTAFTPFCQRVRNGQGSGQRCKQSDAFGSIQAVVTRKRNVFFCPCGLLEVAVPVIIQGQYLGGVLGGQFRCSDAPPELPRLATILSGQRDDWEQDKELQVLFEQVPEISYEQFTNLADLVSLIINQFAEKEIARLQQTDLLNQEIQSLSEQQKLMEKESRLKSIELSALRAQTNPVFVFRCLNTISSLSVLEEAPRTNEIITLFSDFLYATLIDNSPVSTVAEECETLERYLQIQKVRLGERLSWSIQMEDELSMQLIPRTIILPFAERALDYGIAQKREPGHLSISIRCQNEDVLIRVKDNGPGIDAKTVSKLAGQYQGKRQKELAEIGISNARARLISAFGEQYDVSIQNYPGKGTVSIIRYPKEIDERIL